MSGPEAPVAPIWNTRPPVVTATVRWLPAATCRTAGGYGGGRIILSPQPGLGCKPAARVLLLSVAQTSICWQGQPQTQPAAHLGGAPARRPRAWAAAGHGTSPPHRVPSTPAQRGRTMPQLRRTRFTAPRCTTHHSLKVDRARPPPLTHSTPAWPTLLLSCFSLDPNATDSFTPPQVYSVPPWPSCTNEACATAEQQVATDGQHSWVDPDEQHNATTYQQPGSYP